MQENEMRVPQVKVILCTSTNYTFTSECGTIKK